ncbi:tRNA (adenosine(37)-N6)-threonylcarbamoyltransferase complex ATPase subunit type 1 TsaE [Candidatus Hoaglandella endobia]|uniref:tRNA threonylcarbamoyladenosine biosynthesis protein TsaE n=1 Tax=Candidatus Hoaglandella endobia TaxID=1778263 RepID=A0A143WU42_9ENTR|nr:tRNA (adenosine(37)-N6)-threonylcarbamoyltransferase complex ATPase subunit type 1 TsaE [Candidatus Hoaglandella endobia]CUX97381.1 tRNA threonylcarbamoyladenosine biosynthesis protein TsaE [Candidatus Hoaglandella endobia]
MKNQLIALPDAVATCKLGAVLAVACRQPCVIYLYGNLGAGKTTFCRGFLRALGYTGNVKSPTYTLVESYYLPDWTVYHFDLYRLTRPEELELIGVQEYFDNSAFCLVEWPQSGEGFLQPADISLTLHYLSNGRELQAQAFSATGALILEKLAFKQERRY